MSRICSSRRVRSGPGMFTAIVVASTVFSAMTLPLMMQQPIPILLEFPPQWSQNSPTRMDRETRNSIIRYLGIAIVAGVGSGLGAVELLRRSYRTQQQRQHAEAQSAKAGSMPAVVLPDRLVEPTYVPFVPAAIELNTLFAESSQSPSSSAAEEQLVSQSAAPEHRSESAPSGTAGES